MRIALVYRNVNFSGSLERCVALLAANLARDGAEVHCYCNPESSVDSIPGVQLTSVQIGQASLQYDPAQYAPEAIAEVVTKSGYKAQVVGR